MSALSTAPPIASEEAQDQHSPTLVVVDDDRYIVSMLEDHFRQEGLSVQGFTSSVEAQRHLSRAPVDIVITDIKMPEVTGLDLLRRIRDRSPETLVIIITGYSSLQTTLEAVQLGAFDYITKPFLLGEVKLVVNRAIEQQRLLCENARLARRVAELEVEFERLQGNFENLSEEFAGLNEQIRTQPSGPHRVQMPSPPLEAIKPYTAAAETPQARHSAAMTMLEDLHRRGVLSGSDFDSAKRRLAEATGQS